MRPFKLSRPGSYFRTPRLHIPNMSPTWSYRCFLTPAFNPCSIGFAAEIKQPVCILSYLSWNLFKWYNAAPELAKQQNKDL